MLVTILVAGAVTADHDIPHSLFSENDDPQQPIIANALKALIGQGVAELRDPTRHFRLFVAAKP